MTLSPDGRPSAAGSRQGEAATVRRPDGAPAPHRQPRLERIADEAEAAVAAMPADEWLVADVAAALGDDPAAAFAFVRDHIGFDPYPGALRSPRGTLAAVSERAITPGLTGSDELSAFVARPRLWIASHAIDVENERYAGSIDLALDHISLVGTPADAAEMARERFWYGVLQTALETEIARTRLRQAPDGSRRLSSVSLSMPAQLAVVDDAGEAGVPDGRSRRLNAPRRQSGGGGMEYQVVQGISTAAAVVGAFSVGWLIGRAFVNVCDWIYGD